MSPRFSPQESSDSKYPPRDRSPPRSLDRRSSAPYGSSSLTLRNNDTNYRSFEANSHSSSLRDPPREPPRGPKALVDGPRSSYTSRGRGFNQRSDFREREHRDVPAGRGTRDREWTYRGSSDTRDRRVSPQGRGRTRSPPPRDTGRDPRDFPTRDPDRERSRRESGLDVPPPTFRDPGGFRGRGRGEFDYNSRGRTSYTEDREGFRQRSRSRERFWERNQRDVRDRDYDSNRREDEPRRGWDDREWDPDKSRKEPPPFRPDSRNSSSTQVTPSTPLSTTGGPTTHLNVDRSGHGARGPSLDSSRRSSAPNTGSLQGSFKDVERADVLGHRSEKDRMVPQPPSSPPQAPQVPAFGSIIYKATTQSHEAGKPQIQSKDDSNFATARQSGSDSTRPPPSAPKAQLLGNISNAHKVEKQADRTSSGDGTTTASPNLFADRDQHGPPHGSLYSPSKPSTTESTSESRFNTQTPLRSRPGFDNSMGRTANPPGLTQPPLKPSGLQSTHNNRKGQAEDHIRLETINPNTARLVQRDASTHSSPVKIPTGPRAERAPPSIRQIVPPTPRGPPNRHPNPQWRGGQNNLTWIRPGLNQGLPQHTPRGPSIMNTVPTKRDHAGEEKARNSVVECDPRDSDVLSWTEGEGLKAALDEAKAVGERQNQTPNSCPSPKTHYSPDENRKTDSKATYDPAGSTSPVAHITKAAETQVASEDIMDLDEEDYEEGERKFHRELQALEAKRPTDLFLHFELLELLDECDALACVIEEVAHGAIEGPVPAQTAAERTDLGLPSPKMEDSEKQAEEAEDIFYTPPTIMRRKTPPVESLPYLVSGPPTPLSEIVSMQDDEDYGEAIRSRILQELTPQQEQIYIENEHIKAAFANMYRSWRIKNDELEEQDKVANNAAPSPITPASALTSMVQQTSIQGRRQNRNASNLDLDMALEQSMKTYQEEQQNNQLAEVGPNFDKEAVIPEMLDRFEATTSVFSDQSNLIETDLTLESMAFIPKRDDYTTEEHEIFVENYILNPKKWGMIADAIPGRDYQSCIQHYYLTKARVEYKEKERAFVRIKRGRRGARGPQGRAKSNAMMPLYDGNIEFDTAATAVTETGRPKRTAAPTFGSTGEVEATAPAATPLRRNNAGPKGEMSGEASTEKPKRSRTNTVKDKSTRKSKTQLLAPGPSPHKTEKDVLRSKSKEPKLEADPAEEVDGAQLLAGLQNPQNLGPPLNQHLHGDNWAINAPVQAPKSEPPTFEPPPHQTQQKGTQPTASSYWSAPEQKDFQNLLGFYGTNWQAIANAIKTKTHTMVKNYFNRQANNQDEGAFFRRIAGEADQKIQRGENMGPPPVPTTNTKRRYEATPQSAARNLAPNIESIEIDNGSPQVHAVKPTQPSPPQFHQPPLRYQTLAQADPTPTTAFSSTVPPTGSISSSRGQSQGQQLRNSQAQGPRPGYFSEERSRPLLQPQPATPQQTVPQRQQEQHPARSRQSEAHVQKETLNRQKEQEFNELLHQQHSLRHPEIQHMSLPPQPSSRTQQQAPPSLAPSNQPVVGTSAVRITSQPSDLDCKPRANDQSQQIEASQLDSSSTIGRFDSNRQNSHSSGSFRQSTLQSPTSGKLPTQVLSAQDVAIRPSSVPAAPSNQPPRPAPTPIKRSNIMSILNDEPSEPQPRKRPSESRATPPPQSPARITQSYQVPNPSVQQQYQPESTVDFILPRQSVSQLNMQHQQQQQQQQLSQAREAPLTWAAAAQRSQGQSIKSPPIQPLHMQQPTRSELLHPLKRNIAQSPPPHYSHSRSSSYTNMGSQHQQAQATHFHHQQQGSQPQTHAAPNLQPSPYASIQPIQHLHPQHAQGQQLQQQQQPQQPAQQQQMATHQQQYRAQQDEAQRQMERNLELQQRQFHNELRHQDTHRLFQQTQQPRAQVEQPFLRPKEPIYRQSHHPELESYQYDSMKREQRERAQIRRSQPAVPTPPTYGSHGGYGPPSNVSGQGQGQGQGQGPGPGPGQGKYEDRR
ncbi:MAG: hypothetical protein Q9214_002092 [Letrouitia sp. 1 TL-2023]